MTDKERIEEVTRIFTENSMAHPDGDSFVVSWREAMMIAYYLWKMRDEEYKEAFAEVKP